MRHPPPVAVTCSGGVPWRAARSALAAAAAASFAAWASGHLRDGLPAWPVALLFAVLAGVLAWRAAAPRPVELVWDGQCWRADGTTGACDLMLDLGDWLLLRLRAADAPARWIGVSRGEAGPRFHALRAALYSPAANRDPAAAPGSPAE